MPYKPLPPGVHRPRTLLRAAGRGEILFVKTGRYAGQEVYHDRRDWGRRDYTPWVLKTDPRIRFHTYQINHIREDELNSIELKKMARLGHRIVTMGGVPVEWAPRKSGDHSPWRDRENKRYSPVVCVAWRYFGDGTKRQCTHHSSEPCARG